MKEVLKKEILIYLVFSIVAQIVAILCYPVNHYVAGLIIIIKAIVLYFYIVIKVADWNWLDIRAIFSGMWFATIGLAAFRLAGYQKEWDTLTWICLELAYVVFQVGAVFGERLATEILNRVKNIKFRRIEFKYNPNRLFYICVAVTVVGVICFIINAMIKGFIPFFAYGGDAYLSFYTKFYLFAVASTMISGPCYYCIKNNNLSRSRKVVMWLCILYATFLFPTLAVSRGAFMTSAFALMTAIFYTNRKKLWVLILSVVAIFGMYVLLSSARGFTEEQMVALFEPVEIVVDNDKDDESGIDGNETSDNDITYAIPGRVAFLYSYLTVSHDNFNEAIINEIDYSYGARQFAPFNVILRIPAMDELVEKQDMHQIRFQFNTINLIGEFYYDLGVFGIVIFSLLWGCVFMIIQSIYEKTNGVFSLWALGNSMTPVMMCFFAAWMGVFSHWMHWGLAFVMWIIASVRILPKEK